MIENIGKYYLYRHIRLDKNEPFYIGIGTKIGREVFSHRALYTRAFKNKNRSDFWGNIADVVEYEVEILLESNDYDFIKQKEIEFIALHGRRDLGKGTLVNLTDGGDGQKMSEYTKEKVRAYRIGKPGLIGKDNPMFGMTGSKNPNYGNYWSQEQRDRASKAVKSLNLYGGKNYNAKKVLNIITGETYDSGIEAGEAYGLNIGAINKRLNSATYNDTPLIYLKDYEKGLKLNELVKTKYKYKFYMELNSKNILGSTKEYANKFNMKVLDVDYKFKQDVNILTTEEYFYTLKDKIINLHTLKVYETPFAYKEETGLTEHIIVKEIYLNKTSLVYLSDYLKENPDFKV